MNDKKHKTKDVVFQIDPHTVEELNKNEKDRGADNVGLLGNIIDQLGRFELEKSRKDDENPIRLSFESDTRIMNQSGVYRNKANLIPDELLKRLAGPGGDHLLLAILTTRSNHVSLFGRPRDSRFDIGFDFAPKDKSKLPKDPEQMEALMLRVEKVKEILWSCGPQKVRGEQEQPTFSQYLKMIIRDGLLYGRHSTEFINDPKSGKLLAFRPSDAGTIYRTTSYSEQDDSFRRAALQEIKKLYDTKKMSTEIKVDNYLQGDYIYAQVINGSPRQLFTTDELVMHNLYPTTNVEYSGYPLTPVDQVIHAITTHINITMHNKLYFQYGRAARGMLVVKSRGIDDKKLAVMRSQFQQTINSVKHAHRLPVFGIGPEDEVNWQPIDNSSRDMEFQYLSDDNARIVLSAFQMSPDEIPGYNHLSRGSNAQSLSESNNEFKLTAARDVGIRPLLSDTQDFINRNIIPRLDNEVAQYFAFIFAGLDKNDPQKEAVQLQQDMQVSATLNDVLDVVEKERLSKKMGGDLVLNPLFWQSVSPYLTVGEIMENFLDRKGAASDPRYMYIRDPFYFQNLQLKQMDVQQKVQMAMMQMQQAQQMAAQAQQGSEEQPQEDSGEQAPPQQQEQPMAMNEDFLSANLELEALKKKWGV